MREERTGENPLDLLADGAPSERLRRRFEVGLAGEVERLARRRRRGRRLLAVATLAAVTAGGLWLARTAPSEADRARASMASASPLERLDGVRRAAPLAAGSAALRESLLERLRRDPDVNVRLAALDALSDAPGAVPRAAPLASALAAALDEQSAAVVQAHLLIRLAAAGASPSPLERRRLLARPDLHPAVRRLLLEEG